MTKNMGHIDRAVRTIAGAILLFLAATAGWSALWAALAALAGIVLLGTAATGFCPPYKLLGIDSRRDKGV